MPRVSGRWCYVTMNQERFDWDAYLRETNSVAAPPECFRQSETPPENRFKPDMKVVTIDPRNQNSWCIATVISVNGPRLRLRLDGLDNMNDTWKLADAEDIRPISWAKERPHMIVPPLGFLPRMNLWPQFLSGRLESEFAAPDNCFIPSPPLKPTGQFVVGQKLEAVDPKNPSIICVATVSQVLPDRIKVDLDGWKASYFFLTTSRDLFPAGWCAKAGLMLQEPGPQAAAPSNNAKPTVATASAVPSNVAASNQQHANSPDKPVTTAVVRSRNSLQPQQNFMSPDARKRRKSSESSSVNSKTEQASESGSLRKIAKNGSSAAKKFKEKAELKQEIKPAVETTEDESDDDARSPLGLAIDESENEVSSKNAVRLGQSDSNDVIEPSSYSNQSTGGPQLPSSSVVVKHPVVPVSPQNNATTSSSANNSGSDLGDTSHETVNIFINSNCNLGPYLSTRKIAKHHKSIGPSSPNSAVQSFLSTIINTCLNTSEVLKLVGSAMAQSNMPDDALKAITSQSETTNNSAVYSANDVWRLISKTSEQLQCCPNVFSNVRLTKSCADCQRAMLARKSGQPDSSTISSSTSSSNQINGGGLLIVPPAQSTGKNHTPWSAVPPVSSNSPANKTEAKESPSSSTTNKRPMGAASSLIVPKLNGRMSGAASSTDSPPPMLSLSHISSTTAVSEWTIEEVSEFISRNGDPSIAQHADMFKKHEIDGKALLLLNSESILKYMGLKLGPSLKLGHLIDRLKVTHSARSNPSSSHK